MPILRHLHLPNLTPYAHASYLQEILVSRLLRYKASLAKTAPFALALAAPLPPSPPPPPPPTILTFTPNPIYTTGRRDTGNPLSAAQLTLLIKPLQTAHHGLQTAEFAPALRGGQITFHGPGQLVIYPIFSLALPYSFSAVSPSYTASLTAKTNTKTKTTSTKAAKRNQNQTLSPRAYVHLLESTTIGTLARYGITGVRTEDPGVWVLGSGSGSSSSFSSQDGGRGGDGDGLGDGRGEIGGDGGVSGDEQAQDKKIAALGVHLRRNVTSHGVGLNVSTDLAWFGRIVACGLEGKGVTSIRGEIPMRNRGGEDKAMGEKAGGEEEWEGKAIGEEEWKGELPIVDEVADVWVRAFAEECVRLGGGDVDIVRVTEEEILAEGGMERV